LISAKLSSFIESLIPYDYILFGSSFSLFVLFIILGILLRNKTFISVILLLMAFVIIILGPTLGYTKMHEYLFKNEVSIQSQKKLTFVKAVVVHATLANKSKYNFKMCKIKLSVYKVTKNPIKNYIYKLKPFKHMSILKYDIMKGSTIDIKAIVEPFTYSKDYNISIQASCR